MTLLGPLLLAIGAFQVLLVLLARWLRRPLAWEAIAIGLLLPFLVLWPWLGGDPLFLPTGNLGGQIPGTLPSTVADAPAEEYSDVVHQILPWELEIRHAFAQQRLPLWSDRLDGGSSPWVNPQTGVLSPIAWGGRLAPIQHHLLVTYALKLLVAFQGAWVLARHLALRRSWAIVVGLAFALGGAIAPWGLFSLSTVAAWTPWLAAGVVGLARDGHRRALAAASVCAALVLTAGHPEVALGSCLFAATLGLLVLRRRRFWETLGKLAAACAVAIALAGPLLIPFVASLPDTIRAHDQLASAPIEAQPSWAHPRSWFREFRGDFFKAAASPAAFGWPFSEPFRGPYSWAVACAPYSGLWAWAGAALALAYGGLGRRIAGAGLGLVLVASQFIPLDSLLRAVPLLSVPEWSRVLPVAALAFSLAAGLGWQRWTRSRNWLRPSVATAAAGATSLAAAAAPVLIASWLLICAVWAFARRRSGLAARLLALVVLLEELAWTRSFLPRGDGAVFFPETPETAKLRELANSETGLGRVVGQDLLAYPNLLSVYGLADVRPHDPMASAGYLRVLGAAFGFSPSIREYFSAFKNLEHPMLDYLAVRAVVTNRYLPQASGFEKASPEDQLFWILRNPEAKPRFFVPKRVEFVQDQNLDLWIGAMKTADIVGVARPKVAPAADQSASTVLVAEEAPGRIRLQVEGNERRFLATSLPHFAGWTARTSNGTAIEREAVFGAFAGYWIPAGKQAVELRFIPPGLPAGALMFGLGVLALAVLLAPARLPPARPPLAGGSPSAGHPP